jgi:hypothetical protein
MPEAVCIVCGEGKSSPWKVCKSCRFDPKTSSDALVKSVYLSTGRYDDQTCKDKYRNELSRISEDIRSGFPIIYEKSDVIRLNDQMNSVNTVKWYSPWIVVAEFFTKFSIKIFIALFIIFSIIKFIR